MKIETHTDADGTSWVRVVFDPDARGDVHQRTVTLGEWSKLIANPTTV